MSTEPQSDPMSYDERGVRPSTPGKERLSRPIRIGLCLLLITIVGLAVREFPREVARWYLAAALESLEDGDFTRAIGHVDRAVDWDPHNSRQLGLRAQLRMQAGDVEASLADCDRAIEQTPHDLGIYLTRTLALQRLGRHVDAIHDWDFIVAKQRSQYETHPAAASEALADALNGRAYARALGQIDVEKGIADIDEAFDILDTEESSHMLDTRGYLRYLAGEHLQAREDMERAVELAEASAQLGLLSQARALSVGQVLIPDVRTRHELAVLYHHRGLVYEKLGKSEEAEADLDLAEKLGYDPKKGVW